SSSDVEREVDVPSENVVCEREDDFGADAGGSGSDEERAVDRAGRVSFAGFERSREHFGGKAGFAARDLQDLGLADAPRERLQQSFIVHQGDLVAGMQSIEALADAGQASNVCEIREAQLELPENAIERVIAADDELDRVAQRFRNGVR